MPDPVTPGFSAFDPYIDNKTTNDLITLDYQGSRSRSLSRFDPGDTVILVIPVLTESFIAIRLLNNYLINNK